MCKAIFFILLPAPSLDKDREKHPHLPLGPLHHEEREGGGGVGILKSVRDFHVAPEKKIPEHVGHSRPPSEHGSRGKYSHDHVSHGKTLTEPGSLGKIPVGDHVSRKIPNSGRAVSDLGSLTGRSLSEQEGDRSLERAGERKEGKGKGKEKERIEGEGGEEKGERKDAGSSLHSTISNSGIPEDHVITATETGTEDLTFAHMHKLSLTWSVVRTPKKILFKKTSLKKEISQFFIF
jgi:hypothetical protein